MGEPYVSTCFPRIDLKQDSGRGCEIYGQNQNPPKGLEYGIQGARRIQKMKSFVVRTLGLALLGLALTSSAFADGITLNGNLSQPTYLYYTFTSTSEITTTGQITSTSPTAVNEWVSPYPATSTINGVTIASEFGCLDINNKTPVGTFFSGTFRYAVTTADDEVSWLADQLADTTPSNPLIVGGVDESGPISMAIWQIEFPSSTNSEGGTMPIDPAAAAWITEAQAAVASGYQPDNVFFTPDDPALQRFVEISQAPEPSNLILFGSGLLGLAGFLWRRRHSA
jgi:hypothetical protein